jgi:hypothetical protein
MPFRAETLWPKLKEKNNEYILTCYERIRPHLLKNSQHNVKKPLDMHYKKIGAWQSPAFRDIFTFVRRFQIRFFTAFALFLPGLRRTDRNRKL